MLLRRWAGSELGRIIYLEKQGDRSGLAASPQFRLRTTFKTQDAAVYPNPQYKASVTHSENPKRNLGFVSFCTYRIKDISGIFTPITSSDAAVPFSYKHTIILKQIYGGCIIEYLQV